MFAFFPAANEKLGKKEIDRYLLQMRSEEVKRAILVLQQQPTSFASQIINRLKNLTTANQAPSRNSKRSTNGGNVARQFHHI